MSDWETACHDWRNKAIELRADLTATIDQLRASDELAGRRLTDLAAAQAVIEQAPHDKLCISQGWYSDEAKAAHAHQCTCWKSQSSSSALAAHDAEVVAKVASDALRTADSAEWSSVREDNWLRDRAQALRDGQETK